MKIGIICYPTYGGSGVVATELGKYLADKGHEIHFISYSQPARLDVFHENLFYHEVIVSDYPLFRYPPYEIALTGKIVDIVKDRKLDVLHAHYAVPHAVAAVMAKNILAQNGYQIPIVTTLHGTDITLVGKDATYETVIRHALLNTDIVTTVSESLKKETYVNFSMDKDITVIPNFIDFSRFAKHPVSHFKKAIAAQGERIVVHVSNFRELKRVDNVVRIFAKIHEKIPSKLLLVGDGPTRMSVEKLCREYDICDEIVFLGKQEAVEEILSVSDLFLMPSESESFGLAALEAMACEVPVVSSNIGGIPEVNIEGVTGYLLDVHDLDGMAERSIEILEDDKRLEEFKKRAYQQALNYKITSIAPIYLKCYEDAIERMTDIAELKGLQ
jgi:L-malate glycosyltransferase